MQSNFEQYVGQHCTIQYGGIWGGLCVIKGMVTSYVYGRLTVKYGRWEPLYRAVPCGAITTINIDPPPERRKLRMENAGGGTPEELAESRIAVVQSWADASRRDGNEELAEWFEEIVEGMRGLAWIVQLEFVP